MKGLFAPIVLALSLALVAGCGNTDQPSGAVAQGAPVAPSAPQPSAATATAADEGGRRLFLADGPRDSSSQCDAVLLPDLTFTSFTRQQKLAWLMLVTEENYSQAKASGGIQVILEGVPLGASYGQFDEARRAFFKKEQLQYSMEEARAVMRQTLTPAQIAGWVECIRNKATGVRVLITNDTPKQAVATAFFTGVPGTTLKFEIKVSGGTIDGNTSVRQQFALGSGGNKPFILTRKDPTTDLYVIAYGNSMGDHAVSFAKVEVPPPARCIHPKLLSQGKPVTASINQAGARAVTDGEWEPGNWNAMASAPQFVEIDLGAEHIVRHITLNPEQTPAGMTNHQLSGSGTNGQARILSTLHQNTISGGWITVPLTDDEGRGLRKIKVDTISSPSWVSWREIQVWGCSSSGGDAPSRVQ